jgi:tRNA pseudouridine38-40 synthase
MMLSVLCLPEIEDSSRKRATVRVGLVVEYDGTDYFGFQWQDGRPTVQQELEKAILSLTGEETRIVAASRTDTGVHALGQVVSFRTSSTLTPDKFVAGLNHFLPRDIAVKSAHRMSGDFHVQKTAISRSYEYRIVDSRTRSPLRERFAYIAKGPFDVEAMNDACRYLVGEHDFASFTSGSGTSMKNTVRRVFRAEVNQEDDITVFAIEATSFLTHQVRNTVGALVRVGTGKMSVDEFCSIMERKQPGLAGPKAPACGLRLVRVNYLRPIEDEN